MGIAALSLELVEYLATVMSLPDAHTAVTVARVMIRYFHEAKANQISPKAAQEEMQKLLLDIQTNDVKADTALREKFKKE